MNGREFKDITYELFSKIANAFSSPKRLELIDILSQGEKDVDTLASDTNMNFANVSRHLQILKNAKIVNTRREGVRIFYSITSDEVIKCWKSLQGLAEKNVAELKEITNSFLDQRLSFEPISTDEFIKKLNGEEITIIDVRPKSEYSKGHIPGAISLPLSELEQNIKEIPFGKEVVAYCRGKYCVLSAEASKLLNAKGIKTRILQSDVNSLKYDGIMIEKEN